MVLGQRLYGHVVLALAVLQPVSPVAAAAADSVRIAVVGSMTGTLAGAGDQLRRGAALAAKDINAAGGVSGRPIALSFEDDACDPRQAVSVANRVVGEEIKLVDGHVCSGASIPASSVYAENSVLMMSPASVNAKLTDLAFAKSWTTIMRLYARDDVQGVMIGRWMAERYKTRRVAFLHDKSAYGKGLADQVKVRMNALGVHEVLYEGLNPGEKDYTAIIGQLKAAQVEVLYYGGYPTEGGLLLRQAVDQGLKLQMVTTSGFVTPEFWQIAGPAGEGTLFPFAADPRQFSTARQVAEEFRATGFEPEGFTLFSYAVIQALAEGVRRAGDRDGKAIAKALRVGPPIETIFGPISFDAKGDVRGVDYEMNVWHDGHYAKLKV